LLTSSNVESIISVFFKLDLKGGMESAEEMLLYHENEFAKRFYDDILKNKNEIIYYIDNIENIKKDKFIKFINRWLDENTDAIYVYDNLTLVKIYGTNLLKTKQIENFRDSYIVALIGNMKYVVVKIPLNQNMNILLLKKIYKNYEIYESKFRNVYSLLSKKEERFSEVIPYNLRLSLAILYLAMIVVAIIVAILLARQISHPIVSLAAATRKVTEGNLDIRIDEKSEGEIAILIQSFNSMTEELQTLRSRLLHSLRVAAWQEVARRLAHEIKNPLTPIQLSAERMLRKLEQNNIEDLKKAVRSGSNTIIEQVNVLKHLLEEFSNFTRLPSAKLELQNIVPLVKESTDLFKNIPDVIIEVRAQDNLPKLYLDKNLFIGMMNNLLKNAVEAVKEKYKDNTKKGVVLVSITTQKRMGKMFVILKVEDNGPGIPDELKEKIFEPYFSTKEGYGSGLGLALVERAVMEHNARILVLDSSLGGAEFRIIFQVP
jgi:nitrogen fixation/metabolism regulation signal transduction histidine kinase